ncbi:HTH domain-containing protein [Candidatus Saccharibacteria bacterium]|nr:HTH domain-containing protein [Candidatus Saccharibacteria bacterium]
MIRSGINKKRLQNRRFQKTEEKILQVYFEAKQDISVKKLAREVGVARSTVYLHHKSLNRISADYRRYILYMYNDLVKKLEKKGITADGLINRTLLFILQNKKCFRIVIKTSGSEVFKVMIMRLENTLGKRMRLPKNGDRIYNIYACEISGLIEMWAKGEFKKEEIGKLYDDIMSLTETARVRLAPIM